jgi:Vitamin B12 dependent methionine synthase, activation domain
VREILRFLIEDIKPDRSTILKAQGITIETNLTQKISDLYDQAVDLFRQHTEPIGIMHEIAKARFAQVYAGEGLNEEDSPLGVIFPKAEHLALFALTVGPLVCDTITRLFNTNDYALGYMLDAIASDCTERIGDLTEQHFYDVLNKQGQISNSIKILRYSPGYCGWHISGQKKLFGFLEPEEIGITLRQSYLMEPLKSISGVLVAGIPEIHFFKAGFSFCSGCRGTCRALKE